MECYSTTPVTLEQYLINLDAAVDNVAAENDALRAENEALKAKWNSVPLDDLGNVLYLAVEYAKYHLSPSLDDDTDYIQAIRNVEAFQRNAMKEADNG